MQYEWPGGLSDRTRDGPACLGREMHIARSGVGLAKARSRRVELRRFARGGDRIGFAPPFVMTESEIDDMLARFGRTLDETQRELAG